VRGEWVFVQVNDIAQWVWAIEEQHNQRDVLIWSLQGEDGRRG